ncbi:hypothetical protein ACHAWO_009471 [Cyclotella atomus]|uniref:Uncharacterized protein n=1 Tax=Cyclotella atomus TaxID=382360 RepID=A0ABD3PX71_9STRA
MTKSNGWIHGGKYVPAYGAGRPANHNPYASSPRRAQATNSSSRSHQILLEMWPKLTNAMAHILPILTTIIKTIITFLMLCIGGIVYGIEMLRSKAAARINSHNNDNNPIVQPNTIPHQRSHISPPASIQSAINRASPANNNETSTRITQPLNQTSTNTNPSANSAQFQSTATRATPATKSLLRRNTSSTSRRDSFGSKEPRSARRVLFNETSEGQVHRIEVLYDKELPASARKVKVETRESLEARVAAARTRRESYSPSSLVRGGELRAPEGNDVSPVITMNQQPQQRSPLADVNSSSPAIMNQIVPVKLHSPKPSPLKQQGNNKQPNNNAVDANQKRRNLIAVSRYNRNIHNNRVGQMNGYRPGYLGPRIGPANKRQREEVEDWVWKAMNKKGKVEEEEKRVEVGIRMESKTPRKAR